MRAGIQLSEAGDVAAIFVHAPHSLDVHISMDNYATHKTAVIRSWLARRPHYHVHFTPTWASWINQVERWFAELTRKQLRRGVVKRFCQKTQQHYAVTLDSHD